MASSPGQGNLTIEVFRGGSLVKRVEFAEPSVTIGRGSSALLSLDDPSLAELHAVVNVEDDGTVSVLDLGSESGVRVKGQSISNARLRSGEVFEAGALRFQLRLEAGGFEGEDATYVVTHPLGTETPEEESLDEATQEAPPWNKPASPLEAAAPASVAAEPPPPEPEIDEDAPIEDVMAFVMRSDTAQSTVGVDVKRGKVLEINQMWGDVLLDTRHFSPEESKAVTIGASLGYRWHFLGVDMGWVPAPLNYVLPFLPPMWSDVNADWRNDFYTPDALLGSNAEHTLFERTADGFVARIAQGWEGFIDIEDRRYTFAELVAAGKARASGGGFEVPLTEGARLMVDVKGVVFYSHLVSSPQILERAAEDVDYPLIAIMSFMTFIGLMFGLVMYFSPKPASNEMVEIPDRFVELLLEKPEPEEKKKDKPSGNPDAGEGAKAKDEEGKVGKKDAKMEKAKGNKVEVQKKELDRQIAENAGVLGALNDAGDLGGMFSGGLDANLTGGIGGLIGAKGVQIGSGGLGARGSGLGGGGTAEGLGGLGTKGMGSGASGYGSGGGSFGAKGEGGIGTVGGDPIILGALDRSLIDEVIKRHMNQIRYCYQRELTKNPALAGKIVIKFVIAKDGTVSKAEKSSSTMGNAAVESCIAGRFMKMQFPEPKGGGIVIVSYPFIFSPG